MGRKNLGSSDSKSGASDANSSDDTFEMKFKSASNATVSDGAAANAPAASGKKMREPKRTKIFLRNLSEDTTSMDLEELFSDVGPIRRAFVITNKGERKCSGQGFVQFVMEADAAAAVRRYSGKPFKGNRVLIELAKPRLRDETAKKSQAKPAVKHESDEDDVAVVKDEGYDITKEEEIGKAEVTKAVVPAKPAPAPAKKKPVPPAKREPPPKVEKKVVIISGLPAATANTAALEKVMRKYGPLVGLSFPLGPDNAAIVHAEFKEAKSAERAAKKCVDVAVGQHKISAQFRPEKRDGRLIIRNLPFNVTEVDLCEKFGPHGHLVDVVLAKNKETGRLRGFGFVEFATKEEAAAALAKLNAQPIRGRPVAVDWCLTRETYLKHVIEEEIKSKTGKNATPEEKEKAKTNAAQKAAGKQEIKVEEDDEEDEKEEQEVSDDDNDEDDDDEDSGSGDEDDEDDEEEDGMDESDDDDDEDGEEADEMDHDELVEVKIEKEDDDDQIIPIKSEADADASGEAKPKRQAEDVQAGSTLFIRNLPFGATVADLRSKFASFGRIRYCALVKDKTTGMPRGSAFLQFVQKTSADAVLAQVALFTSQFTAAAAEAAVDADSDAETTTTTPTPSTTTSSSSSSAPKAVLAAAGRSGIFMEGRELQIDRAVDKGTAQTQFTLASKKESEERDKRNLYLATEGYITPEMGLKMGLSKLELARREEAMRAKKQKLKNPNFFVSKTRLSVRNLPKSVTDKQLKQLFTDAVLSSTAASAEDFQKANVRIKQAKIVMGDNERSKGFGFVEFEEHDHALIALREMNNSPKPFGEKRRLLVEFALEDRRVVESRKKRLQTQQVKLKKQREIEELESGGRPSKAKQQQQAATKQKNAKNADKSKAKKQDGAEANNKQAGQKRKREDNSNNGADKNNNNNKKNANAGKANKKEQQVKKQKVAADEQQQQQQRRPQPQQPKRAREEAESTKLSRKQRAAAKKRKDVDALDTLVNQYKERLFAPVVAKEATKRWFE